MDSELAAHASLWETLLKRDRALILVSLAGITALSWVYLVVQARSMDMPMSMAEMAAMAPQGPLEFLLTFVMWLVMMIGMMLPSAAPMILLFNTVNRRYKERGQPYVETSVFTFGYLLVWGGFSLVATIIQTGLNHAALLSPAMASTSPILGGALFIATGIYQWTPLKNACLGKCRSPLDFIMHHWRTGTRGAFLMGLIHGAFCLGCCWLLMGILFIGGVMNLMWVAGITAFLLVEKLLPQGVWVGRFVGFAMILAGAIILL